MNSPLSIFNASKHYSNLLDSFSNNEKIIFDPSRSEISEAMYFHICKMKYAGWRHRVNFNRSRKHSLAEIFQDTVAFYLKAALPDGYVIELEPKIEKMQPDIAIKKGDAYTCIIEVKTTIGWSRPEKNETDPFHRYIKRIDDLSKAFEVPPDRVIYIFEEHGNVGKDFSAKYWVDNKPCVSRVMQKRTIPCQQARSD